ncbi:zinc-binding dehydrogenase [Aureimonas ureilytica]|uniref:zinc-binding dehydrogenase n=1 Tax=Aureimonas ureilytica TaxID=401562 RepID=UPI00035F121D|nr:zinc-binding dehydrogenase [Aureimonas ureilytica]
MKSAAHETFGDPAEVLHLADSPLPEPGPGEVRVRTILSPIHNHDLWTVRGSYGYKPELPAIGGSEAVGTIEAVGEGVDGAMVGRRVAVAGVHGTWAEAFLAKAGGVMPVPDEMADEAAAQLIAMPFSAITLLEMLDVKAGDWVVQNAANGAVGRTLAALAQARGVHVVNLVRREEGVAEMEAAGIAHTISTAGDGWKDKVRALTGGAPIKAGVDSVGGQSSADLADLLAENGLFVCFGSMTGEPMIIPSGAVIFKQLVVKGFWGAKVMPATSPEDRKRLMGELVSRVLKGELKLQADEIVPLADIARAVKASLAPGKVGKVLLKP